MKSRLSLVSFFWVYAATNFEVAVASDPKTMLKVTPQTPLPDAGTNVLSTTHERAQQAASDPGSERIEIDPSPVISMSEESIRFPLAPITQENTAFNTPGGERMEKKAGVDDEDYETDDPESARNPPPLISSREESLPFPQAPTTQESAAFNTPGGERMEVQVGVDDEDDYEDDDESDDSEADGYDNDDNEIPAGDERHSPNQGGKDSTIGKEAGDDEKLKDAGDVYMEVKAPSGVVSRTKESRRKEADDEVKQMSENEGSSRWNFGENEKIHWSKKYLLHTKDSPASIYIQSRRPISRPLAVVHEVMKKMEHGNLEKGKPFEIRLGESEEERETAPLIREIRPILTKQVFQLRRIPNVEQGRESPDLPGALRPDEPPFGNARKEEIPLGGSEEDRETAPLIWEVRPIRTKQVFQLRRTPNVEQQRESPDLPGALLPDEPPSGDARKEEIRHKAPEEDRGTAPLIREIRPIRIEQVFQLRRTPNVDHQRESPDLPGALLPDETPFGNARKEEIRQGQGEDSQISPESGGPATSWGITKMKMPLPMYLYRKGVGSRSKVVGIDFRNWSRLFGRLGSKLAGSDGTEESAPPGIPTKTSSQDGQESGSADGSVDQSSSPDSGGVQKGTDRDNSGSVDRPKVELADERQTGDSIETGSNQSSAGAKSSETTSKRQSAKTESNPGAKSSQASDESGSKRQSAKTESKSETKTNQWPDKTGLKRQSVKTESNAGTRSSQVPDETGSKQQSAKTESDAGTRSSQVPDETGSKQQSAKTESKSETKTSQAPDKSGSNLQSTKIEPKTGSSEEPDKIGSKRLSVETESNAETKTSQTPDESGSDTPVILQSVKIEPKTRSNQSPGKAGSKRLSVETESKSETRSSQTPDRTGSADPSIPNSFEDVLSVVQTMLKLAEAVSTVDRELEGSADHAQGKPPVPSLEQREARRPVPGLEQREARRPVPGLLDAVAELGGVAVSEQMRSFLGSLAAEVEKWPLGMGVAPESPPATTELQEEEPLATPLCLSAGRERTSDVSAPCMYALVRGKLEAVCVTKESGSPAVLCHSKSQPFCVGPGGLLQLCRFASDPNTRACWDGSDFRVCGALPARVRRSSHEEVKEKHEEVKEKHEEVKPKLELLGQTVMEDGAEVRTLEDGSKWVTCQHCDVRVKMTVDESRPDAKPDVQVDVTALADGWKNMDDVDEGGQ